jgi:hypothetical protein
MNMTQFTKRTDWPKLGWLISELEAAGITCELGGESFHAPILLVDESKIDQAWEILDPVDDIEDDDPRYAGYEEVLPRGLDATPIQER